MDLKLKHFLYHICITISMGPTDFEWVHALKELTVRPDLTHINVPLSQECTVRACT